MTHRLERILRILSLLQSGAPFNALQLAQETAVHRRTVFRDVALLRAAGIPIRFDPETACYSLMSLPEYLSSGIRTEDLLRLLEAASVGNFALHANADLIGRVVQHLASSLTPTHRAEIEQLLKTCRLPLGVEPSAGSGGYDHEIMAVLMRAVRLQQHVLLLVIDSNREVRALRATQLQLTFNATGAKLSGTLAPEGSAIEISLASIREASIPETDFEIRRSIAPPPVSLKYPNGESELG
jgi:predicted DNA-binding transcriptional regulator YafY